MGLALALLLIVPAAGSAQQDPQSVIRTTVSMVVVPVTVKDGRGNLVSDLRRDDFRVLEDGVEQRIAVFTTDPFPLSVVVLLDNNLTKKTAEQVQDSVLAITSGFGDPDEVALMVFDQYEGTHTLFDLTTDKDWVFTQIKRLRIGSSFPGEGSAPMTTGPRINAQPVSPGVPRPPGHVDADTSGKNIDDAVYAAGQILRRRARDRRKIILLISDGNNSRHNTMSFDDTLHLLLSADISLYALDVSSKLLNPESSVLVRFARRTGGDIFHANKRADLEKLYAQITEQARNQYTLAYSPLRGNRGLAYHSIEVRVRRPDLTLLARDGYFTGGVPDKLTQEAPRNEEPK